MKARLDVVKAYAAGLLIDNVATGSRRWEGAVFFASVVVTLSDAPFWTGRVLFLVLIAPLVRW